MKDGKRFKYRKRTQKVLWIMNMMNTGLMIRVSVEWVNLNGEGGKAFKGRVRPTCSKI